MSAYLIDESTMHRALMGLSYAMRQRGIYTDDLTVKGQRWFQMNIDALKARYGNRAFEPGEPVYDPESYRFKLEAADRHPVDYYKALQCLRYQCTEGDVVESDTFKELDAAVCECAARIISGLPEYERAEW